MSLTTSKKNILNVHLVLHTFSLLSVVTTGKSELRFQKSFVIINSAIQMWFSYMDGNKHNA